MRIGSLFSGIGGLELGLERAGVGHTAWQVEQSAWCRARLAERWPDALRFEDVRTVGAHNLPPVDVICGGFPCQDISVAGRKAGILPDTRSGLWHEYARILRELRPRYAVVENVSALLALGMDVVLGELAESGFDAEWDCVPASAVGAPHQRDRVFLLAYATGHRRTVGGSWDIGRNADSPRREWLWVESRRDGSGASATTPHTNGKQFGLQPVTRAEREDTSVAEHNGTDGPLADATSTRLEGWDQPETAWATQRVASGCDCGGISHWWCIEPRVGRVVDGLPDRVDRLKGLGNAVVPQVAEVVGRVLLQIHEESQMTEHRDNAVEALSILHPFTK